MTGDPPVVPTKIDKRFPRKHFRGFDFRDEDSMVAGEVRTAYFAVEMKQHIFENGDAVGKPTVGDAEFALFLAGLLSLREVFGDGFLALPKNADAEPACFRQQGVHLCAQVNAHEDQERIERDGSERVGRHTVNKARFAFDGDDGDASGEVTERAAKVRGGERRSGHRQDF